jgi:glycosyltransferase involved in cell wall biosynthesis
MLDKNTHDRPSHEELARNLLSIVVPCFNEECCIMPFFSAINDIVLPVDKEVVFVDDGSSDSTLSRIKECALKASFVRYVSFSRNFGKEAALLAGLRKARGNYVVTMDVDLQDPPELLVEMLDAVRNQGFDCAATCRIARKGEPPIRSFFARMFYKLMHRYSDVALVDGARDYRLMRRNVVDAILSMPEVNRFTKGIYQWVGFKTKWLAFENVERKAGETKWSFFKLFSYAIDGVLAFSTAPLQVASVLGFLGCVCSLLSLMFVVVRKLVYEDPVAGWASLVCIMVFFFSMLLFFLGIFGLYLAKIYRETKRRPLYIVNEEN